ncbi:unnamed protein product [Arabidopsis halleri]
MVQPPELPSFPTSQRRHKPTHLLSESGCPVSPGHNNTFAIKT